jgi:hypothetical protein
MKRVVYTAKLSLCGIVLCVSFYPYYTTIGLFGWFCGFGLYGTISYHIRASMEYIDSIYHLCHRLNSYPHVHVAVYCYIFT